LDDSTCRYPRAEALRLPRRRAHGPLSRHYRARLEILLCLRLRPRGPRENAEISVQPVRDGAASPPARPPAPRVLVISCSGLRSCYSKACTELVHASIDRYVGMTVIEFLRAVRTLVAAAHDIFSLRVSRHTCTHQIPASPPRGINDSSRTGSLVNFPQPP